MRRLGDDRKNRLSLSRPLFVVSNDYGELGLAMLFLRGQELAARAALALPERLHAGHRELLPGATHPYSSVADILTLVEAHRANVVLLFSGYLLANGQVLSHELLAPLVASLRERGCVVVTSDPFLGIGFRLTGAHIGPDVPFDPAGSASVRQRFAEGLARASEVLDPTVHLYHCAPAEWLTKQRSRSVTFFNSPTTNEAPKPVEKRWLFVLGSEDVALQQRLIHREARGAITEDEGGVAELAAIVAGLLEQTIAAGRKPTLIAPPALLEALPSALQAECDLRPFCSFPEFLATVLESEYVYYWNVFSASILPRLALRLPVFFFDRGHMARVILPLYELGLKLHFGGWKPAFLDHNRPLDAADLARRWDEQGLGNQGILDIWRQASPSPDALLDALVANDESILK